MSDSSAEKYITPFIEDMRRCDDDVDEQRQCACFLSGALYNETNKLAAIRSGAVDVLTTALRVWKDPLAKKICISSITTLAYNNLECKKKFPEANIFEPLVDLLSYETADGDSPAAFALFALTADFKEGLQQLRGVNGIIEALKIVDSRDDKKIFGTAEVVLNELRQLSPTGKKTKAARG